MAFRSVPEADFLTDIQKSRLVYLKSEVTLSDKNILISHPDVDKWYKLPSIVINRVWSEVFKLARNSGTYKTQDVDVSTVEVLKGYRYMAMYQFDIVDTTIWGINKLVSAIHKKLRGTEDVFANGGRPWITSIPVRHFASPQDAVWQETDLFIQFRYHEDIDSNEQVKQDKELHWYAISVDFRVNYLKAYSYPKISEIDTTVDIDVIT